MSIVIFFLFLIAVFFPKSVNAYLDPSTGSYFLQLAIGLLLGATYLLRVFWGNIKSFVNQVIKRLKSKD